MLAVSAHTGVAATHPDWIARGIALAGVLMAAFTLISTRSLWRKQGPLLAFDLWIRAFRHPGTNVVHRIQVRIEVFNVGRMPATVRGVELRNPWSKSYVATDITAGGFPVLAPTEFEVSNGVEFTAPDEVVRAALNRPLPADMFADEIAKSLQPKAEALVRGRVRRGDGKLFTNARRTAVWYEHQPWPGLASPETTRRAVRPGD